MKVPINTRKIGEYLIQLGMNHADLARATKLDESIISRVFSKKEVTPRVLKRIADVFKCFPKELLCQDN